MKKKLIMLTGISTEWSALSVYHSFGQNLVMDGASTNFKILQFIYLCLLCSCSQWYNNALNSSNKNYFQVNLVVLSDGLLALLSTLLSLSEEGLLLSSFLLRFLGKRGLRQTIRLSLLLLPPIRGMVRRQVKSLVFTLST